MISRRSFLQGIGVLVGGVAIEQAIPLGRVWSFPKEIKCVNVPINYLATVWYDRQALELLGKNLKFTGYDKPFDRKFTTGQIFNIRKPARYAYQN